MDSNNKTIQKIENLIEEEEYEQALHMISQVLKEDPDNVNILLLKGEILKLLQKFGEAINVFQRVLKLDPDNQEALSLKNMTQDILRFEQLDIYSSTNLSNDPWLD